MKKTFFFILIFCILATNISYAWEVGTAPDDIYSYFANPNTTPLDTEKIKNTFYTVVAYIGCSCAILITLATGISFLSANSQKKAMLKDKLWLIATGVIILAAGPTLLPIVVDLLMKL